ncbi:MAG: hypothetical protein ACR2FN_01355 [Chitinophagaceae bacterium]
MKKILLFFCFLQICFTCFAQNINKYKKKSALAIQFILNDFSTAVIIKQSSIGSAINNKNWSALKDMNAGIAFQYLKGLNNHIDFSAESNISFLEYPLKNNFEVTRSALIEADAGIHLKMLPDKYIIVPYLSMGIGASFYKIYFGAYMPVGAGFQFNIAKQQTFILTCMQYRFSFTNTTSDHFNYSLGAAIALNNK